MTSSVSVCSASEVQSGGRRLLTEQVRDAGIVCVVEYYSTHSLPLQLQIMVDVWDECRREGVTDNVSHRPYTWHFGRCSLLVVEAL